MHESPSLFRIGVKQFWLLFGAIWFLVGSVFAAVDGYPDGCQYCPPPEDPIPERWCSVFMMHGVMPPCDLPALGVDAGPWPIGDASASYDAGHVRDGAVGPGPGFDGGCTVAIAPVPARPLGHELVFVALIVVRIARSRARSRQRAR